MPEVAALTARDAAARLRRLARHLDRLSVAQLLELREATEELLRRERLDTADAEELLDSAS